jgi:DNA-binding MarR family transcriptional regulator
MLYSKAMSSPTRSQLLESLTKGVRQFIAGAILFNLKVAEDLRRNATDLQCLNLLEIRGSATPGELARWARLTTGGITVVLDRLERAGYVRRESNPRDRRSSIIRPVAAGTRKIRARYRSKGEALAGVLAKYDDRELRLILDFFERVNSSGEASDA